MKKALILMGSVFFCQSVIAYEPQRAIDNFAEDVADCIAYFTIVTVDAKNNAQRFNDPIWSKIADDYVVTGANAIALLKVSMAGKPEKFIKSKIDLHMQSELTVLRDEGMDRLEFLYKDQCKSIMENPKNRIDYWINK